MALEQTLAAPSPYIRSIVRIVVALLFLEHGLSRLFGWPSALPAPPALTLYWFAGAIELGGGLLFALGLFTRPVAFLMSGEMAAAYFIAHFSKSVIPLLNGGNEAVIYCFVFLYFVFAGPGPWSVDAMRGTPLSKEMT